MNYLKFLVLIIPSSKFIEVVMESFKSSTAKITSLIIGTMTAIPIASKVWFTLKVQTQTNMVDCL